VNAECADPAKTTISLKKDKNSPPLIYLCTGNLHYMISYQKNPYWHTRWGIWAATWLAVFLFTLLVRKTQKIQIEKRFATEKKITELQLKIVRNQMDPHFTMNAINAVVDAINREEKEQARDNLLHFSKMYRSLVLSADKIKQSLREELEFTENYLALEKFRFANRFTYNIRINPDVDLGWEVPKMVIQSPVENAVKHGLNKKENGGEIVIHARHEDRKLILEITDNGVGRAASAGEGKTSTGKGMEIMEQFFELYHKITGARVQTMVTDLKDEAGKPAGTKVVVIIPLP
jgi:LytS/YehU family sensor histidine kinase